MSVSEATKKELADAFGPAACSSDDTLHKLDTLKQIFNISTEDLYVHWETYNINEAQDDLQLTPANLDVFQQYLQRSLAGAKRTRDLHSSGVKRKPLRPLNSSSPAQPETPLKMRRVDETPYKTPHLRMDSSPSQFATANNSFGETPVRKPQKDANTVLETLNDHLEAADGAESHPKIASNFDAPKYKFRTMAMKLLESADVLDDQIDTFTNLVHEQRPDESFANPCLSSQFDIACCGRIVPDSPLYDKLVSSTLNSTSLYLETSRLGGIGQRVPLDLTQLKDYSFFPGQVVCFRGRNPTSQSFVVSEVIPLPQLGTPVTASDELKEYASQGEGLKTVIASGPFSNAVTLNYEKFTAFVEHVNTVVKPNVVVLFGPFLDITNAAVQNGDVEIANEQPKNLDDVFRKTVTPVLKTIDANIQVILIPSLKDVAAKHCSYPQDSFDRKKLGLPKNVKVFPNPSGFAVNEILFGCSNLDIFKDLKDVSKLSDDSQVFSNRFERIANHIFDQRNYYPIFPGSIARQNAPRGELEKLTAEADGLMAEEYAETTVGGSQLEVPYLGLAELGDSLPDVLVIPSELRYFAKVIKNVVVINPGAFIRPSKDATKEDGTYVVISTRKPDTEAEDNVEQVDGNPGMFYHNVFKRSRVDIYKS